MILNYVCGDKMKLKILTLSFIFCAGCGIKGPPLPPLKEETIQSQQNWDDAETTIQSQPTTPKPVVPVKKVKPKKKQNEN